MSVIRFMKIPFMFLVSSTSGHRFKNVTMSTSLSYSFDTSHYRFRVCGAYCGPGWCNNKWLDEDKCDTSVKPEYHKLTGYSCADSCCQSHDRCCGKEPHTQQDCNKEIVDCLSKCDPFSLTCTFDNIPIIAGDMELAMDIVEKWCCGAPCP